MEEHLKIKGIICSNNKEFDVDEFTNDFIDWIESKGLCFGGGITQIKVEEELDILNELKIGQKVVVKNTHSSINKYLIGKEGYVIDFDKNCIVVDLRIEDDFFEKCCFYRSELRCVDGE